MSVDDPESCSGFCQQALHCLLSKYCIQIIYANKYLFFIFFYLSSDQWGPAHWSYSDPILITLILSFIQ